MTANFHLQSLLLEGDDPWMYKLDDHSWVILEAWVVDDAIAIYKGSGASLKAALQVKVQCIPVSMSSASLHVEDTHAEVPKSYHVM